MSRSILRRLVFARFLSTLADQFLMFAVPLVIYRMTGSVSLSGLAFSIEWLPRVISLPLAGVLSDRLGSRRVFLSADAARAMACAIGYALLLGSNHHAFAILSVMSACVAFFYAQGFIALEAVLPRLLPGEDLPKAQSKLQGIEQVSAIGGPILASIATACVSSEALILLAGISFATSFAANLTLPELGSGNAPSGRSIVRDLGTALGHIRSLPGLSTLIGYTVLVNLIYGTIRALSAPITTGTLGLTDRHFGFLNSAAGAVTLLVLGLVPWLLRRMSFGRYGAASFSLLVAGAALCSIPSFTSLVLGFAALNGATALFNVYIRTERARVIPAEDLGKTIGFIVCINQLSLPVAGLLVAQGSGRLSNHGIVFGVSLAATLGAAALWLVSNREQFFKRRNHEAAHLA